MKATSPALHDAEDPAVNENGDLETLTMDSITKSHEHRKLSPLAAVKGKNEETGAGIES